MQKQGKQLNQIEAQSDSLIIAAITTGSRGTKAAVVYAYTALVTRQPFMALCAGVNAQ